MKIALCTPGRFHLLDLARELSALGHEVRFYSYVPKSRTARFGLPGNCDRSGFYWMLPLLFLHKVLSKTALKSASTLFLMLCWDWFVSKRLEPCEVLIAMSGSFPRTLDTAKVRWGATLLVERGSRHILSQKRILDAIKALHPACETVPEANVRMELWDYEHADRIVVPSRQVLESFTEQGVSEASLFRNPYGVDLSMFRPTPVPPGSPTVLMVGSWSYRKGCDILAEAVLKSDWNLLHAGTVLDCPFPDHPRFRTLGHVDQASLVEVYAQAHVFALPSLEEGLALVQAQALACGLSLVCTERTGGADFIEYLDDPSRITVVKSGDAEALRTGIQSALSAALGKKGLRGMPPEVLERFTWAAYGRRYDQFLRSLDPVPGSAA